ncbi:MAG: porin family protein [Candidatus Stygibacter australis]|nr:porin family protein [Candidatus Stygibacter australis]
MKKNVILLLLIFVIVQLLAYDVHAKGVKGGINFANFSSAEEDDLESKAGLILGGFVTYIVNDQFSFQPEIYFTMKGAKSEWGYGYEYKDTFKLNYFEVPFLGVMNIPVEASFAPKLFFGPALGVNLSATYKIEWEYTYDGETESGSENGDLDEIIPIEFGLIFGGTIEFEKIVFDLRYNMGLTDILDYCSSKNRVFSILLGYKF